MLLGFLKRTFPEWYYWEGNMVIEKKEGLLGVVKLERSKGILPYRGRVEQMLVSFLT
uniref:Uncharacterized protein n=1 Tax=Manihot esculenta TaxID=3983 RepID=A0A2C9WED5_MANES